jgi:hypothetical protein
LTTFTVDAILFTAWTAPSIFPDENELDRPDDKIELTSADALN